MATRFGFLTVLTVGLKTVGAANPNQPAAPPVTPSSYLDAGAINPALLLPAPPSAGSAEERRELLEVREIMAAASPAERAQVKRDDGDESPDIFDQAIAPDVSLRRLPKTWALLTRVAEEIDTAASRAKRQFGRTRPWGVDRTIVSCDAGPGKKPVFSYPSGHAMLGYSVALVLARMVPDRAPFILARAQHYGFERVECGAHYPSDVEASHVLASIVVSRLDAVPTFRADVDDASAELQAALSPRSRK